MKKDENKTKSQLIHELQALRSRVETMEEIAAHPEVGTETPGRTKSERRPSCEMIPLGYLSLDEKARIRTVNNAWTKIVGYSKAEVLEKWFGEFIVPEEQSKFTESFETFKDKGESKNMELTLNRRNGSRIPVSFHGSCEADPKGALRVHCILKDITMQRRLEAKLRQNEMRFRALIDSTPDAIMIFDAVTLSILEANVAACEMYGYSYREMLTLTQTDLTVEPEKSKDSFQKTFRSRAMKIPCRLHKRKDGTEFPVEISESVFHTGDRDFFCGIVRDISEQLQTDQTLRLRDSALSAIGTGVMITAVTGTDHPIIYCNPAFERISGYTSAEVLGRDGRFMQGDDTDQPGLQRIRSALAANREVHAVVRNYRKNGTMFWNKLLTTPFRDTSGKTTHFVCVIEDVTEQIRAEEDLRELSQQMAKIQEREHQRIAGELHDRLGQSLTTLSISLTAERNAWIASGQDNTTKRLNECLYVVEEMGCHIEDLMGEMHPPVLDDYGIVSALRCYAEHFERRTGIIVEVECGEEPERLSYDQESGLFRIVQEALANIVKHAEATSVRIGVENTAVGMRVIIRDDGKGFEMPRIERRRKRRHWGLVIMRERARALGGEFYADSVPGQGTRITVDVRVQPNDDITK